MRWRHSGKDHRVRIVPSATFAALRIRSWQPDFFVPRLDYYALPIWTIFMIRSLSADAVPIGQSQGSRDPKATPGLLESATDVEPADPVFLQR